MCCVVLLYKHDGEGLSLKDISNLVNHPLTKLVEQVIKKPEDSLRCLNQEIKQQPVVKGAAIPTSDDIEIDGNDMGLEDGEMNMESDAKVPKLE